jgi:hypothetical protein
MAISFRDGAAHGPGRDQVDYVMVSPTSVKEIAGVGARPPGNSDA